jgi:hypothetical protein
MSFSIPTILHSGTRGTLPYVTPASTIWAAIRSNVTPRAGFVKSAASVDNASAWATLLAPIWRTGFGANKVYKKEKVC